MLHFLPQLCIQGLTMCISLSKCTRTSYTKIRWVQLSKDTGMSPLTLKGFLLISGFFKPIIFEAKASQFTLLIRSEIDLIDSEFPGVRIHKHTRGLFFEFQTHNCKVTVVTYDLQVNILRLKLLARSSVVFFLMLINLHL